MFPNLGMSELILILVIALVVFGPSKLPEMGKTLGRAINEFRRASINNFGEFHGVNKEINEVKNEVKEEVKQVTDIIKGNNKENY